MRPARLPDLLRLPRHRLRRHMAPIAVRMGARNRLLVQLGQQDVRDRAVDRLRSSLQQVRQPHQKPPLAQPDRRIQRGEPAKPDVQRRHRRARAKLAILLLKDFDQCGRHAMFESTTAWLPHQPVQPAALPEQPELGPCRSRCCCRRCRGRGRAIWRRRGCGRSSVRSYRRLLQRVQFRNLRNRNLHRANPVRHQVVDRRAQIVLPLHRHAYLLVERHAAVQQRVVVGRCQQAKDFVARRHQQLPVAVVNIGIDLQSAVVVPVCIQTAIHRVRIGHQAHSKLLEGPLHLHLRIGIGVIARHHRLSRRRACRTNAHLEQNLRRVRAAMHHGRRHGGGRGERSRRPRAFSLFRSLGSIA